MGGGGGGGLTGLRGLKDVEVGRGWGMVCISLDHGRY